MPVVLSAGVSFSDYRNMTLGEIKNVVEYNSKKNKSEAEYEAEKWRALRRELAAFSYNIAVLSRSKLPDSVQAAFPKLFGRTEDGGIPADNWQACKAEMGKFRAAFRQSNRQRGVK